MIRGIYTAAAGLATATLRLGVVSNNVANVRTPGYKQDRVPEEVGASLDLSQFAVDSQGNPVGEITLGPRSGLASLDLGPGALQETGNPLDLAIGGDGFFVVRTAGGALQYTRDGGFNVDRDGFLRTRDGIAVLGQDGNPLQLPAGQQVEVAADGTIRVDGQPSGQLLVVRVPAGVQLVKQGNNRFALDGGALPQPTADAQVYQGYLEGSNVDMSESMVAVMNLVRAYAANQRMLQIQDQTLVRAVNDVGRV